MGVGVMGKEVHTGLKVPLVVLPLGWGHSFTVSQPLMGGTSVRLGQNSLHICEVILAQAQCSSLLCQMLQFTGNTHSSTE